MYFYFNSKTGTLNAYSEEQYFIRVMEEEIRKKRTLFIEDVDLPGVSSISDGLVSFCDGTMWKSPKIYPDLSVSIYNVPPSGEHSSTVSFPNIEYMIGEMKKLSRSLSLCGFSLEELLVFTDKMALSAYNYNRDSNATVKRIAAGGVVPEVFGRKFFREERVMDYSALEFTPVLRALFAFSCYNLAGGEQNKAKDSLHKEYVTVLIQEGVIPSLEEPCTTETLNNVEEKPMSNYDFNKPSEAFTRVFGVETTGLSEDKIIDMIRAAEAHVKSFEDIRENSAKIDSKMSAIEESIAELYAILDEED
jgi:hypothetical protein